MDILMIYDERKTANTLKEGLEDSGYKVDVAYDGLSELDQISARNYDLVVSDVVMPKVNGIDLCKRIRIKNPDIPILLLTALDSKDDTVSGLESGADDYLTKPFDFRELLARIANLLKRSQKNPGNTELLKFADLEINVKLKRVSRAGVSITLTPQEFKLLEYFMRKPNVVIPRMELAREIWNLDFETGTNVVEVYLNYLRNKVEKPFKKKLLHN